MLDCWNIMMCLLPTQSKIKFEWERSRFTIRASNACFAVCTYPHKDTVMYTIVDIKEKIRGTENLIFWLWAESDEDCINMLQRLTIGESRISERNFVELKIKQLKNYWDIILTS